MATDQSPLDLHSRNYKLSLDAPAVDETTKFVFATISIQTRQKTTNKEPTNQLANQPTKNHLFLCIPDIPPICRFKT